MIDQFLPVEVVQPQQMLMLMMMVVKKMMMRGHLLESSNVVERAYINYIQREEDFEEYTLCGHLFAKLFDR